MLCSYGYCLHFLLLVDAVCVICRCRQACQNPRPEVWCCIVVSSSDLKQSSYIKRLVTVVLSVLRVEGETILSP